MSQDRCQSWDAICRRAGGRRKYNHMRQIRAEMRLLRVLDLLGETGFARGYQSRIARALEVSTSTVSRDIARLFLRYRGGREAKERHQAHERMKRHIRRENEAERQRMERRIRRENEAERQRTERRIRRENEAQCQRAIPSPPFSEPDNVFPAPLVPEPRPSAAEPAQAYEAPQSLRSIRSGISEIFRPGPSHAERRRSTHRRRPGEGVCQRMYW